LAVIVRIASGRDAIGARLFATALLVYVVHLLSALSLGVPLLSRVDPRVYLPSARRFAVVTVAFVLVFAAARAVGPGVGSSALFVLAGLAAAGVLAAALAAGRRR
jgi:hypothetical protein